jgi:hypothetical protein
MNQKIPKKSKKKRLIKMNERLLPQFEILVDQIAEGIIESLKEAYTMKEYSVENLMLNVFTSCIFKTVAKHLKKNETERFSEQIKTNLMMNFNLLHKDFLDSSLY